MKRGESVGRYNYFDDDFENEKRESKLSDAFITFGIKLKQIKDKASRSSIFSFDDIAHGETIKALKTMPNVRALLLKLLAFILFLIAIIAFIVGFSHTIHKQNKKNEKYYADAAKVCTDCITDYGSSKWDYLNEDEYGEGMAYLTGLCYARQMDFDNDGSDELMLCYNNGTEYVLEVWGYVSGEFSNIYSETANHTESATDGYWISFYRKNNKYYICKSEAETPEKVIIYALKGDSFKKSSECDYDYTDNIYTVKGKINAYDFETIKLSVIKASKADATVELVSETLQTFSGSALLENDIKSEEQLKLDAYYNIVTDRIKKHGSPEVKSESGLDYIDGVSYVSLIDFNDDGNDELVVVYRKMIKSSSIDYRTGNSIVIENPTYCVEVYGWNGTIAKKLFSKDSISSYEDSRNVFYLTIRNYDGIKSICINDYVFKTQSSYTASAQIYALEDENFETAFSAVMEYEYGWKRYYINGETAGENTFYSEIERTPLFLDDYASYDSQEYTLTYMSGKDGVDYNSIVSATTKNIQKLNKNYNPDMKLS